MPYVFDLHQQTRKNILELIAGMPEEKLLQIPPGFHNNLLWNAGHVIVVQQLLCYRAAGAPPLVSEEFIKNFRKDSSPADWSAVPDVQSIKTELIQTAETFYRDFKKGLFLYRQQYPVKLKMVYGVQIAAHEEAVLFNNVHEAMHLGIMTELKKLVS